MRKIFKSDDCVVIIESQTKTFEEIPSVLTTLAKEIKDDIKAGKTILDKTLFVYDHFYNTIRECKPVRYDEDTYRIMEYIIYGSTLVNAIQTHERVNVESRDFNFYGGNAHHWIIIAESKEDLFKAINDNIKVV